MFTSLGKKNVLLVLLDSTQNWPITSINIDGVAIPIYSNAAVVPADLSAIWYGRYTSANIGLLRANLVSAFNEIAKTLGVENSAAIAVTMASELYAKVYQGIGIRTKTSAPQYDITEKAYGAYTLSGDNIEGTDIAAEDFAGVVNQEEGRKKVIGYNFSGLSSWGRPPSGEVKTYQEDLPGNQYRISVWSANTPLHHFSSYTVFTANSLIRVAISAKLLSTYENKLYFPTATGFASWIHMCSVAQICNTALLLAQTNISLSMWAGYCADGSDIGAQALMDRVVATGTSNRAKWFNFFSYFNQFNEWDAEDIVEYYSVDVRDPAAFHSYFPIPVHLLLQWETKLGKTSGEEPIHGSFRHNKIDHRVDFLGPRSLDYRWKSICTPSFFQVHPMAIYRGTTGDTRHLPAWIDQWSAISIRNSGSTFYTSKDWASQVFAFSPVDNAMCYTQPTTLCVLNGWYSGSDKNFQTWSCTDLEYPDPIPWQSILQGAKNWILQPALAGLTGYATGGIPGAIIGAGGALMGQGIKEFSTPGKEQSILETASKVLQHARELQPVLQKTSTSTPTQTGLPQVTQIHTSQTHSTPQETSPENGLPITQQVGEVVVPSTIDQAVASAL